MFNLTTHILNKDITFNTAIGSYVPFSITKAFCKLFCWIFKKVVFVAGKLYNYTTSEIIIFWAAYYIYFQPFRHFNCFAFWIQDFLCPAITMLIFLSKFLPKQFILIDDEYIWAVATTFVVPSTFVENRNFNYLHQFIYQF